LQREGRSRHTLLKLNPSSGLKTLLLTEMDNGRMRVRSLGGGISKLEIDHSVAAGFATNVTNDLSHPGRVFLP
jgi:hypothetical protein